MNNFKLKYLKYKAKYLGLKNKITCKEKRLKFSAENFIK